MGHFLDFFDDTKLFAKKLIINDKITIKLTTSSTHDDTRLTKEMKDQIKKKKRQIRAT